ncbi:MAG: AAA family ATPase [Sulfuricurvum sp.]|uniref:AAA family ATPase n=1 Tax=Sulfuricurvum sp. TaxID=2025608 RepID=UPI00261CB452|nr:AAA family ATPase [Sulfuricurvum sp.]MDD2829828.1 AAA family ATPase [Sulfuricurvum sp.]MDD4949118.1 AAA family ATPase [Sulfuricurvum sp.]
MELVYLWVEKYKNIDKQGFNFSPRFECTFHDKYNDDCTLENDCVLDIKPKEHIENFFGKNINITAIVGENGSGKSSIFEFLINELSKKEINYVCVFQNKTNNKIIYTSTKQIECALESINIDDKLFGYINISAHENTINIKINHYFGLMGDDGFTATNFDNYIGKAKTELNNTDPLYQQVKKEIEKLPFLQNQSSNKINSSGEKAMIYYLSCIYLLLEKVQNQSLIVCIDEIELFMHPNWQKKVIQIFIQSLVNKLDKNLHIIFASHSPFILSDIPKENVIFLENGIQKHPFKDNEQTFGANIHTLLSHGFFMEDGLMGEFAKDRLSKILKYLIVDLPTIDLTQEEIKFTIDAVGEELLQNKLENLYNKFYQIETKEDKYLKRISELEALLKEKSNA